MDISPREVNMSNIENAVYIPKFEICPVCKISRRDGVFYWSNKNTPTTSDEVKSRVCIYATESGCINQTGQYDAQKGYEFAGEQPSEFANTLANEFFPD